MYARTFFKVSVLTHGEDTSILRVETVKAVHHSVGWTRTPYINPRGLILAYARSQLAILLGCGPTTAHFVDSVASEVITDLDKRIKIWNTAFKVLIDDYGFDQNEADRLNLFRIWARC
jgi:hypothetical protein